MLQLWCRWLADLENGAEGQQLLALAAHLLTSIDEKIDFLLDTDASLTETERAERNKFYGFACNLNAKLFGIMASRGD